MSSHVWKIILFLLLTAGAQYIGASCCALPVVLLALAIWQWRKIGAFKKRAWMAENPAKFNPDMIDCYVRFEGRLTEERPCHLPLSGSECVYYAALVAAEWQVKAKKPSKGMETVRKPLLREQSVEELELADKDCRIYIKVEEFTKSCLKLNANENTQEHCPPQVKAQENSKYQKYHMTEQFLLHGDSVTAQGRLALNQDGRLFIKPTHRLEFPSFLVVKTKERQFVGDLTDKALHDAWSKRINVAFLLLNAVLFIRFWF